MKPKRSLGQNFLKDKSALKKIAAALVLGGGNTVIEIGPGHGELTRELRIKNRESRILAIEKDGQLVSLLRDKFKNDKNVEIIGGDVLSVLPEMIKNKSYSLLTTHYKLVGNIPYYLTGHLLRILSELDPKPKKIVLLIQKEVANRLCACPPEMNLLAASVQFWARPRTLAEVDRKSFRPAPKVDSAIIEVVPLPKTPIKSDVFYLFITALFKQPRKTILNNLAARDRGRETRERLTEKLKRFGIDPADRPQNLDLPTIIKLARGLK